MTNQAHRRGGVAPVVDWLVEGARTAHAARDVLAQLCDRLVACRPAAASGRGVCAHPASRRHGPALALAPRRRGGGLRRRLRPAPERELSPQPRPDGVHDGTADPPANRRSGLPRGVSVRGRAARGGRERLSDPAPALHQRRDRRDQLDHHASRRFRRCRPRRARGGPPAVCPPRRDLHAASHRDQRARHLCRPPCRRAHPAGPDPARRHREHRGGHHADRPAGLHHREQPAARRRR